MMKEEASGLGMSPSAIAAAADGDGVVAPPIFFQWMEGDSLAPPCQSESDVIEPLLQLIAPYCTPQSVLYDLGCGDGRICIAATKRFHCYSVGVEIEEHLVKDFRANIAAAQIQDKVTPILGDLQQISLSDATIVIVYLLPESIELIKDQLCEVMRRGGIVICSTWRIKGLTHKTKESVGFANNVTLYLYDASSLPS